MKTVIIKNLDKPVSRLGLGCMGMSEFYGPASSEVDAFEVMAEALDLGVQMFDTADFYGDGANEELIGRFIKTHNKRPVIATKCGIVRSDVVLADGNFRRDYNGQPDYIRQSAEQSLQRLGVECLDLFYLHRIDPKVPIEESMDAMKDLVQAGKIKAVGLSEADEDTLRRANQVHPVSALQSEFSLWSRHLETTLIPVCEELGITFVPYAPLGRGMVPSQKGGALSFASGDFRATLERAMQENVDKNQFLYEHLYAVGEQLNISAFQVMLAWLYHRHPNMLPIPGSRQLKNLRANVAAEAVEMPEETVAQLSDLFASDNVSGGRYTVNKAVTENAEAMR